MKKEDRSQLALELEAEPTSVVESSYQSHSTSNIVSFADAVEFSRQVARVESLRRIISLRDDVREG